MRWRQELSFIIRRLIHRRRAERELDEEIRAHLEMETERNVADGMSPEDARLAARRSFGSVALAKEDSRVMWGLGALETLWQDLRYGVRMLLKSPNYTLIAVITLSLGIGANTAIFSVVNAVLLRPLPYKDADRLMMILETKPPQFPESTVSPANFLDWKKQNTVFERLVAYSGATFNMIGAGDPERLRGLSVSEGFMAIFGAQPQLGRVFLPEEDQPGRNNVVILSHRLWQRRFGGDPKILSQVITLDGQNYTVIGVMPATFSFGGDLWTPMAFTAQQAQNRGGRSLTAMGQLKPGVALDQARAEMSAIAGRLASQYPRVNTGWNVKIIPLPEITVRNVKDTLLVLLVAVAFVLLIACVNVANLLLARAAGRRKEIGIRAALGARRARIVRQLLTENALLAFLGGAVGLLLAKLGMDLLLKLAPQNFPRMGGVSLDGRALAFTAAITLLTGVIFGLVPALQASRPNLNETLKDGRNSIEGGRRHLTRGALVVLEVASSLVSLVGAGLMIKSFWRLQNVDPGFNPDNALTVSVSLPRRKYPEENQQAAFFQQLVEKAGTLPGVQAAGATSLLPLGGSEYNLSFGIQGRPTLPPGEGQSVNFYSVSAGYFKAMGIRLLRGRLFTERDSRDSQRVAIINETMAKKIFPDDDPIGKRITVDPGNKNLDWFEIVGIVGDVKHAGIDRGTTLQTYEPYTQRTFSYMTLVVRAEGDPASLTAAIRSEVLKLDKEQPVSDVRTLDQIYSASIAQRRFSALLLGVFAAVALALAAVGVYGVLSYAVTQRTHEIGIRMALGAARRDVLRLVIGRGMLLTLIGVAAGLGAAFALTRLMSTLLFEVSPTDPLTFSSIGLLLGAVALLACWIPSRRATKVDPLMALKHE
jgi:putative ABC transport system permease protein